MNNSDKQENDEPHEQKINNSFVADMLTGLAFFSLLPVLPAKAQHQTHSLARSSRAFGVVGLVLGTLTGLVFWFLGSLGLSTLPAVIVALAFGTIVTGGLHEDGLADVADGFGGGWTAEKKLEIMRDSQIGTYGMLALIFSMLLRVACYAEILGHASGLITIVGLFAGIGCLSRGIIPLMMYQLPMARKSGRAVEAGVPSHDNLRRGLFITAACGGIFLTVSTGITTAIAVMIGAVLSYMLVEKLARKNIGGYTGDVLGTLQQVTELTSLLLILLFL